MKSALLEQVKTHKDVPYTEVDGTDSFAPSRQAGVTKYCASLPLDTRLEALLVNKQSDVLVVALHGATNRHTKELPRFEWFRTLRNTEYSSLYLSDPTLQLNDKLELAWYTGWRELDLYPVLANWIRKSAAAVGAEKILILGSSGGGLAALQISTYIPGSMALPFSCQTSIAKYRVNGTQMSAQKSYIRTVMPHLEPPTGLQKIRFDKDWSAPLGERTSAILRYSYHQPNYVYYVQNRNDFPHVEQHYVPFKAALELGPNAERVRFVLYDGPENHNPPRPEIFLDSLISAIAWLREAPSSENTQ